MKLWFSKKGGKTPYDATVEQTLLYAQEVDHPLEQNPNLEMPNVAQLLREPPRPIPAVPAAIAPTTSSIVATKPAVSRTMREEMQARVTSYRSFQMKLNDDREARMRKTMADMRTRLQLMATPDRPSAP